MSDIEKVAVFDERIVQSRPVYAVEKGAVSLTNVPFAAIAQNAGQQTYQIQVPSENVFVDRAVDWTSTCYLQFQVVNAGSVGAVLAQLGEDLALAQFPLHTLVQTLSATINDTTVTMNTSDVLREVLRLTDHQKNRLQRTCPTYPDNYYSYNDAFGTVSNPLGGYGVSSSPSEVKNGAYYNVAFCTDTGQELPTTAVPIVSYANPAGGSVLINNGIPEILTTGATGNVFTLYLRFTSTEKLVLSPFVFSDVHAGDTGLFGIQNIQLVMNMQAPSFTGLNGRVLRTQSSYGNQVAYVASPNNSLAYFTPTGQTSPFVSSSIKVQFLTPSLDLPLPPRSIVPYMEFPRYVTAISNTVPANGSASGQMSQTITLPSIPDLLIIYAKPNTYSVNEADWYLPITQISCNFDNYSGLLSSHRPEQLYQMSISNGLVMDYNQWIGQANNGAVASGSSNKVPLTGGFLVLKPSKDITLQSGMAPSLVGNFTFQFNCTVNNNSANDVTAWNLWVITANSGFFESVKGSSRIVKGVLDERSILSAPPADVGRSSLDRMVGGSKFKNMMGNAFAKMGNLLSMNKAPPMMSKAPALIPVSKKGLEKLVRG
jgi:hypothetical protein